MRGAVFSFVVLGVCAWSTSGFADENEQGAGCPFESDSSSGSYEAGDHYGDDSSSSSDSDSEYCPGFGDDDDGYYSGGSTGGGGANIDAEWPESVGLRLSGGFGTWDWSGIDFQNERGDFAVAGSAIAVGAVDLAGGEFVLELAPTEVVRFGMGFGFYGPVGGQAGGDLVPGTIGDSGTSSELMVFNGFAELGFAQRIGILTMYASMRAGVMAATVDIEASCGCAGELSATRLALGPRFGLRAPLYRSLFVSGSVYADATSFPDYVASVGLGFGRRAL